MCRHFLSIWSAWILSEGFDFIMSDRPKETRHRFNSAGADLAVGSITSRQRAEVEEQRSQRQETIRATVPALENLLYAPFEVLDHGFLRVVDYMGDDGAVVQAARVSYGHGTRRVSDDRGLIRYLMRNRHTTPFEMCEIKLHVKLPIFVARQWIRHRTANVNEYSARYSILDREFYVPSPDAIAAQSRKNRQGRGDQLPIAEAARVQDLLREDALRAYDHYEYLLNEDSDGKPVDSNRIGLARELARMNLSLNYYTHWYWKIDLHNLLNFLSLRAESHAQYEIRVYANIILEQIVKAWVPLTYEAFRDYRLDSELLSARALSVVRALVSGRRQEAEALREGSGLQAREWGELMEALGLDL
jgi:thymidylate synthase (FAD)